MSWKFMNAQNRHWHPSGRWLISEPQRNGDDYYSDIYLLHDLKTGEVGSLSLPGEDFPWQWSPDGTWLYAWTQEGRDVSFFRRPLEADVWEERQIKSMTAMPGQPFSYDGSRIIVARTWRGIRDLYAFNFTTEASDYLNNNELYELAAFWAGPEDSLWVYGMNTSGETYLWNEEAPEGLYRVQNRGSLHFSPSPDGSCLLYADHAPGQTQTDIYQVCLGDVSPRLPLGTTPENEAEPVYVPDVTLPWRPERSAIAGALLILLSLLGAYAPNISPAFTRRPGRTAHSNSPASSNTPSRFR
jgi:Tol biopolymer transport system component